jgi:SAM-dependent methyltransferase
MQTGHHQENLAMRSGERWRPPTFTHVDDRRSRAAATVRRFFDLQAGSLWSELRRVLPEVRGTLVDVGCGAQPYRRLLPRETEYIGLDTEHAHADFGYAIPDIRLIGEDGNWPLDNAVADVVLATETLEHVVDPPAFLAQAHRCLRPGGRIVLTVPFAARWHYVPNDYWRFTPSGMRTVLERAGFTQVVVHARGNERTVACYKLLALLLPAALPQDATGSVRLSPLALLAGPPAVILAALANLSLRGGPGDDCLGYTVYALRGS